MVKKLVAEVDVLKGYTFLKRAMSPLVKRMTKGWNFSTVEGIRTNSREILKTSRNRSEHDRSGDIIVKKKIEIKEHGHKVQLTLFLNLCWPNWNLFHSISYSIVIGN